MRDNYILYSALMRQAIIGSLYKSLYSAAAFKKSQITSGLTVLKRTCKERTW